MNRKHWKRLDITMRAALIAMVMEADKKYRVASVHKRVHKRRDLVETKIKIMAKYSGRHHFEIHGFSGKYIGCTRNFLRGYSLMWRSMIHTL